MSNELVTMLHSEHAGEEQNSVGPLFPNLQARRVPCQPCVSLPAALPSVTKRPRSSTIDLNRLELDATIGDVTVTTYRYVSYRFWISLCDSILYTYRTDGHGLPVRPHVSTNLVATGDMQAF